MPTLTEIQGMVEACVAESVADAQSRMTKDIAVQLTRRDEQLRESIDEAHGRLESLSGRKHASTDVVDNMQRQLDELGRASPVGVDDAKLRELELRPPTTPRAPRASECHAPRYMPRATIQGSTGREPS